MACWPGKENAPQFKRLLQLPVRRRERPVTKIMVVGLGHQAGRHDRRLTGPKNSAIGLPGS